MFKKVSSGVLIIVLAVLLAVYFIVRFSMSDDRTFRDKVLSIEPGSVTGLRIIDPKTQAEIALNLIAGEWKVSANGKEYSADTNVVKNLLRILGEMPTKRFAGKGNEAMVKYEVTDTAGTLVELKTDGKIAAKLIIGKFSYNIPRDQQQMQAQGRQPRGEMTSYVRLAGEKEVYAVEGFLKSSFSTKIESYRVRSLTGLNPADINRIKVTGPGSAKVIENLSGTWTENGLPADSASTVKYRSSLARLSGSKFIDFDPGSSVYSHTVVIEGNNFTPVELRAYPVADTNVQFIITSSNNPGACFNGKEGGLFNRIWPE